MPHSLPKLLKITLSTCLISTIFICTPNLTFAKNDKIKVSIKKNGLKVFAEALLISDTKYPAASPQDKDLETTVVSTTVTENKSINQKTADNTTTKSGPMEAQSSIQMPTEPAVSPAPVNNSQTSSSPVNPAGHTSAKIVKKIASKQLVAEKVSFHIAPTPIPLIIEQMVPTISVPLLSLWEPFMTDSPYNFTPLTHFKTVLFNGIAALLALSGLLLLFSGKRKKEGETLAAPANAVLY